MEKKSSEHAQVARIIRAELKKHSVKGHVKAKSYYGESSVTVTLNDALPETCDAVNDFCDQFRAYRQTFKSSPPASFVFLNNDISSKIRQAAWTYGRQHFEDMEDAPENYSDRMKSGFWARLFAAALARRSKQNLSP